MMNFFLIDIPRKSTGSLQDISEKASDGALRKAHVKTKFCNPGPLQDSFIISLHMVHNVLTVWLFFVNVPRRHGPIVKSSSGSGPPTIDLRIRDLFASAS